MRSVAVQAQHSVSKTGANKGGSEAFVITIKLYNYITL